MPVALAVLVVLLVAISVFVVRADGADDDQLAAEIERLSQPPVIHEARLLDDRIELDVAVTDDTDYCLDPSLVRDGRECDRRMGGPPRFYLDDLTVDADELVGREIRMTARSSVTRGDGALPIGGYVVSEPSSPVEVVDAR